MTCSAVTGEPDREGTNREAPAMTGFWPGRSTAAVLWALVLTAAGCGPCTGTVSGVVRYKGEPLAGFVVSMATADGRVLTTETDAEGAYTFTQVPVGTVQFMVAPPFSPPAVSETIRKIREKAGQKVRPPEPHAAAKQVRIPDRYKDKEQSGLQYTIEGGPQTRDLDLTD
jgi:carboxypeptidase family protein